ncbi:hypothetical protein E4T39_06811 [Aureobasidium subglaciale]|nr:hypothetical protein E4T39_06811 [Aureobasidium subglaciale]
MEQIDQLFCQRVLDEFRRPKHRKYVGSFKDPIDATKVPTYRNVIQTPMDIATITSKLHNDRYDSAVALKRDFDLMFDNCDVFNAGHPPSAVYEQGKQFREQFESVWQEQGAWVKKHYPEIFEERHRISSESNTMQEPPAKKQRLYNTRHSSHASSSSSIPAMPRTSPYITPTSRVEQDAAPNQADINDASAAEIATTQVSRSSTSRSENHSASNQAAISETLTLRETTQAQPITAWETFQEQLRALVRIEAQAMLNDTDIKLPSEPNFLARSMWQAMGEREEEGKACLRKWVEQAVNELAKVPVREVGDAVRIETKRALVVIMEEHYEYLRLKMDRQYVELQARFEE